WALVAVMLTVAASDQCSDHPVPGTATPRPITAVRLAAESSPAQPPATSEDCTPHNLRASLRPQGPLPAPGQMPAGSTMARIAQQGHLTVGVLEDTYPMSFRDVDLQLKGFDIDVARDIAGAIFGNPERVVFRPVHEATRFEIARSDQVDLVVAAATITCPRRELVDFSTVYYEGTQQVLVNRGSTIKGLDDLRGKRVCAAQGATSVPTILAASSKPILVGATTQPECLMLLQLGEVDAVWADDTLLAGMVKQDRQTEVVNLRLTAEPYGVVIKKKTPDLVRFVNAVLERRAQDGRWRASYEHWLTPLGPPPSPPTPQYRD
ncbi:MAG: glutamate ABC transporter substrate-binding protein, partial [Pseudonocardiales bacterium]|nr:glutamate ABC transporter substrate-binding protein [Pseudonocardiales bacterium]